MHWGFWLLWMGGMFLGPKKISPIWWISSRSSISLVASCLDSGELILLSNVYALTNFLGKSLLWDHLRYVWSLAPYLPWIVVGDFNYVLSLEEKRGDVARLDPSSGLLRDNVELLSLIDVKSSNGIFTWNNRQCGEDAISERLNRFLVWR